MSVLSTSKPSPTDPSVTSAAYDKMSPRWFVMNAILGGTETMREHGESFLPKHTEEAQDNYQNRLKTSYLLNITEITLDNLIGKPFEEPLKLDDDVPPEIRGVTDPKTGMPDPSKPGLAENIDLNGTDIGVFCRDWMRNGVGKGFAHVLIDMPRAAPKPPGKKRTLKDDKIENMRPYWVHVAPENVIFMHATMTNGEEKLDQVRIVERTVTVDGFMEVPEIFIRVLTPGHVAMYKRYEVKGKVVWKIDEEWDTELDYIPFVTYYPNREDVGLAKPPLLDLAYLNIAHWQSTSDQNNILTVSRFPMLAGSGIPDDAQQNVKIGPRQALFTTDPAGKYYYVETTGNAINEGMKQIAALEAQMAGYGAQFLKKQPGRYTAAARALDSAEAMSALQVWTIAFVDAVERALAVTCDWLKINSTGGTVEMNTDFITTDNDPIAISALQAARAAREISRKTFTRGLWERGVLPDSYNLDADVKELTSEPEFVAPPPAPTDPGPTPIPLNPL